MPSPFHGIELAGRALSAFQRGMDIAGHNISNVNTRGYTRQTADYYPTDPTTFFIGRQHSLGTGVSIASVNRIRDLFLYARQLGANGEIGRFETLSNRLAKVEPILGDLGPNGIPQLLDRFYNAWSGLAASPSQPAARLEVQAAGQALALGIRSSYSQLSAVEAQLKSEVTDTFGQIDQLTARIGELNKRIRAQYALGAQPNDLMDQRDLAIEDLAKIVDVQTYAQKDGSVHVHMGSIPLVDSGGERAFPRSFDSATYSVTGGSLTHGVRGGSLYGLFETLNLVSGYKGRLDDLANSLRSDVNAAHVSGIGSNGATGLNFFAVNSLNPASGAIDFALDPAILADIANIAAGTSGNAGDGSLALAIGQMRDQQVAELGNQTVGDFFRALVAGMGQDASFASKTLDTQMAVAQQIEVQRQSVSGVSLDEEMANMLRLQRSYQAAAKALTLFDQVTEDLINLIR